MSFNSSNAAHLLFLFILLFSVITPLSAQQAGVGQWSSHLPYQDVKDIVRSSKATYVATDQALYSIDHWDKSISYHNKITGLSDMGVQVLGYNIQFDAVIIGYTNGNIDVLYNDGSVKNFASIKQNNVLQINKTINHIDCYNQLVYLSTAFGLVVLDLEKEVFASTTFTTDLEILAAVQTSNAIFVSTTEGIYKAPLEGGNILDFENGWEKQTTEHGLSQDIYTSKIMVGYGDTVFAAYSPDIEAADTIIGYFNNQWQHLPNTRTLDGNTTQMDYYYPGRILTHMAVDSANKRLLFSFEAPEIYEYHIEQALQTRTSYANQFYRADHVVAEAFATWVATYNGVWKFGVTEWVQYTPEGPTLPDVANMIVNNDGELWVAGSKVTYNSPFSNNTGFYQYSEGDWTIYNGSNYPNDMDGFLDVIAIESHPTNGSVYLGSFVEGLLVYDTEQQTFIFNSDTSTQSTLQVDPGSPQNTRITDFIFDEDNNLWMANHSGTRPFVVWMNDDSWKSLAKGNSSQYSSQIVDLAFDRNGFLWVRQVGGNLAVYDFGDLDTDADDRYKIFTENNSELASSTVNAVVADKNGVIWVGTGDGISIFSCGQNLFDSDNTCFGNRPIVSINNFLGYLLTGENVTSIAVDGGNRKWVGTNNGVFLLSEDYEQIYYFNEENSPLFSNSIKEITIDGVTGTVYFATEQGLQSYRGEATTGTNFANKDNVKAFPNPVPPDYTGLIAISGLLDDSNVKITDVSGRLIYETTSLGGQVVWDGNDYTGRRANSGVYLVFSVNSSGTQKLVSKLLFLK